MAFTSSLATPTDSRLNDADRYPVWERIITYTIDANDGSAEVKQTVPVNGILLKIIAESGAAEGITGTFTLAIDDDGDNEIFTAATPVTPGNSATSTFNVNEPVNGTIDVGLDPNDDPTTGTWVITITLRGI